MHVVEGVDFGLDVVAVRGVAVVNSRTGRRGVELALLGPVIVVVVLAVVVDLMINIVDRIGKRIKFLLFMLLRHVGVVLLLLEAHLNRNSTP